jgi:hypothetical protein
MRLSGLSLTAVLLFASFTLAQHSSGGSSSNASSSSGSSGGGSHSSSSGGSSYSGGSSGGSSHSSGGGSSYSGGGSHSSGGGHSAGGGSSSTGNHGSSSVHPSGGMSVSSGSSSHGKNDNGSSLVNSRNGMDSSPSKLRPIHEPKSGIPQRAVVPEKRSFFTFLRHPFRRPQPKVEAKPTLYLPRPICPKGHCAPACPVGQVRKGGVCSTPAVQVCVAGQTWNHSCSDECSHGEIWNGGACLSHTRFLDSCFGQRTTLERQAQRVQAAETARRNACANGPAQECSEATGTWQSEENLRRNLLARYQQCQTQSMSRYSAQYKRSPSDGKLWLDSLRFNEDF